MYTVLVRAAAQRTAVEGGVIEACAQETRQTGDELGGNTAHTVEGEGATEVELNELVEMARDSMIAQFLYTDEVG